MTSSKGPSADPAAAMHPTEAFAANPVRAVANAFTGDRVWTVPNALSMLRLLGVPLFLWLLLGPQADGWAIVVLMLAGISDWADGKIARALDQHSRLGTLLDPAADRLYIVATLVALALRDIVPMWLVLLLLAREVVLAILLVVLRRHGYQALQVHYVDKAATFILLYAFPSLLDQVLAETLDPAYRQAADERARKARGGAGETSGAAHRSRRSAALVGVTLLATGLLLATAYNQAAAESPGREEIRAALIADIERESAVGDRLTAQLDDLEADVDRTRDHLLDSTVEGQRVLEELGNAEAGAAAVQVSGPGLLVTLADAEAGADDDPVGGTVTDDPRGNVDDGDLQLVVNALWAAGAEAISINDERLGPTSAIRFAGEAVLVDFRPVMNPYEIRAIGDPDTLSARFLASPEVNALAVISESFDLRFEFAQEDELTLPAASTLELRYAAPVDPQRDAPGTDPTPGG